jgi:hypothetical protein
MKFVKIINIGSNGSKIDEQIKFEMLLDSYVKFVNEWVRKKYWRKFY